MADYRRILKELLERAADATGKRGNQGLLEYMAKLEQQQADNYYKMEEKFTPAYERHVASMPDEVQEKIKRAVSNYTGSQSKEINAIHRNPENVREGYLKNPEDPDYQKLRSHSDNLRLGFIDAPEDMVVYRGLDATSNAGKRLATRHNESGDPVFDALHRRYGTEGFVSTSLNPIIAAGWGDSGDVRAKFATHFKMLVPQGARILPALRNSNHGNEREIILDAGDTAYRNLLGEQFPELQYPKEQDFAHFVPLYPKDKPLHDYHGDVYDKELFAMDGSRYSNKYDELLKKKKLANPVIQKAYDSDFYRTEDKDQYLLNKLNSEIWSLEAPLKKDYQLSSGVDMNAPWYHKDSPEINYQAYNDAVNAYRREAFTPLVFAGRRPSGGLMRFASGIPATAGAASLISKYLDGYSDSAGVSQ